MTYPIERRAGEIERLHVQAVAMAPDCAIMLDRIGVNAGWHCLDLGCGPGGITALLSERVGPAGHVVGFDADEAFLEHARRTAASNVMFVAGDAYHTGLPDRSFDLVHMRFLASTAGRPEALLAEAIRLARAGGIVAMQEPDMTTLVCYPPHPAWDQLRAVLVEAFASVDADINLARSLYLVARRAGLRDVEYRPFVIGVRAGDPMVDYLPSTVQSLAGTIIGRGLLSEHELTDALADCRAHLRNPDVAFTMYTVAQVWGRAPGRVAT
jgi:ubiquinone/menaquinone biosynthesis C-methylase UbiE